MSLGLKGLIVLRIIRPWITEREEVGGGGGGVEDTPACTVI